jgi:hypothetical protein
MFAVLTFYFFIASLRMDMVLVGGFPAHLCRTRPSGGRRRRAVASGDQGPWGVTLAFAVLAWYHAASDVVGFTFGRRVLSVGSLKPAVN